MSINSVFLIAIRVIEFPFYNTICDYAGVSRKEEAVVLWIIIIIIFGCIKEAYWIQNPRFWF